MAKRTVLPKCPTCYTNVDVVDRGIDCSIRQYRQNYRCEKCGKEFQVSMGPEANGMWLMTLCGPKPGGQFIALFQTWDGRIYVNRRSETPYGTVYVSGECIPGIKLAEGNKGSFRLAADTNMDGATTLPDMEIERVEWGMSLKSHLLSGPDRHGIHDCVRNDRTTLWRFPTRKDADYLCRWLRDVIQEQYTCKTPKAAAFIPPAESSRNRSSYRPEIHGSDLLSLIMMGMAVIWLIGSIATLGFFEGLIYGIGIPLGILVFLGIIFGGW